MSYPKMTLRIKLSKKNHRVDFDLIQVTDIYCNIGTLLNTGYSGVSTENDWFFMVGASFSINTITQVCIIPKRPNKAKDFIIFANETERYSMLKDFHEALIQWSSNEIFKGKKAFTDKPNIKFHKDVWIIF